VLVREIAYNGGNGIVMPGRIASTPGVSHEERAPMTMPQFTQLPLSEQEVWRPVVGWEGWYEVSSLGRVRRAGRTRMNPAGHVLRPWPNSTDYPRVGLSRPGQRRRAFVHVLVAGAFLGSCPPGMEVNHKDLDRWNARADNLEYVTHGGNQRHAFANGQPPPRGEQKASKLTEADVLAIRASSEPPRVLAVRYGISRFFVWEVRSGRAWRHLAGGRASKRGA
jgi:hypothetical protein